MWLHPKDNVGHWTTLFREKREAALNHFDDEHPSPETNMAERIMFQSRPSRTVKDVGRLREHLQRGLHSTGYLGASSPSTWTRKNRSC
jgi:hypothetical protein